MLNIITNYVYSCSIYFIIIIVFLQNIPFCMVKADFHKEIIAGVCDYLSLL